MPNIKEMLNFLTENTLAWLSFAAVAVILLCIACLLPRGKENKFVLAERIVISVLAIAVPVTFIVLGLISENILPFDAVYELLDAGIILTTAVVALVLIVIWGAFTSKSYITQALYGMVFGFCLPYGLINLMFPALWATKADILAVITTPLDLAHLLMYAACFFIPVWLVRSGEYVLRLSSVWHLFAGLSLGGCTVMFVMETGLGGARSETVSKVLHSLDGLLKGEKLAESNVNFISKVAVLLGIFAGIILLAGLVATIVRKIRKSETPSFLSESVGGGVVRTIGNILANGVCIASIFLLPQVMNHTSAFPGALVYLAPVLAYFVITFLAAFIADTVEIKRGIKLASEEQETAEDAAEAVA